MSAVLTAPAFSARVDRRSVVISGLQSAELIAGRVYTLIVRARGIGPLSPVTARIGDAGGGGTVWSGTSFAPSADMQERRWVFTAEADATAATVLELLLPIDQVEEVLEVFTVERWALMAGSYPVDIFDGDGEDTGGALTAYHAYAWDGAVDWSASSRSSVGTEVSRQILHDNWRRLRRLLWNPGRQVALTKRWRDEAGVLRTATALAEFAGGLSPDVMAGGTRGEFSVDLLLADPFFYDSAPQAVTVPANGAQQQVTVLGDYRSRKVMIDWAGKMTGLTLTASDGVSLTVNDPASADPIGSLVSWHVDVEKFVATKRVNAGGIPALLPWTGNVVHAGAKEFFSLAPGLLGLGAVSSLPANTPVTIVYYPAWL